MQPCKAAVQVIGFFAEHLVVGVVLVVVLLVGGGSTTQVQQLQRNKRQ